MAKAPVEIRHRFRIHAEITPEALGPILAQLTMMGLENVGYELVEDTISFNKKTSHAISAEQALTEWIKEHPTFPIKDAVAHFKKEGRNPSAVYTAAKVLVEKKILKKLSPGNYSAADVKHIEGPKKDAKPAKSKAKDAKPEKKKRPASPPRFDIPNRDIILQAIGNKKGFSITLLTEEFKTEGRNPKSISPIVTKMIQAKDIKSVGAGEYEMVSEAIKKDARNAADRKKKRQSPSPNPALNGLTPTPTTTTETETAHG